MKSADHLDECSSNSDCKTNVDSNSEHRSGSTENLYPSLGIDEIKTLLRYKSMVYSLMIDQKKEINGLFPSLGEFCMFFSNMFNLNFHSPISLF